MKENIRSIDPDGRCDGGSGHCLSDKCDECCSCEKIVESLIEDCNESMSLVEDAAVHKTSQVVLRVLAALGTPPEIVKRALMEALGVSTMVEYYDSDPGLFPVCMEDVKDSVEAMFSGWIDSADSDRPAGVASEFDGFEYSLGVRIISDDDLEYGIPGPYLPRYVLISPSYTVQSVMLSPGSVVELRCSGGDHYESRDMVFREGLQ